MGGRKYSFSNWLLYCFFLSAAMLLVCGPAIGQEEKKASEDTEEFSLEEIVVTGSRIARTNNEATSPIVTVDDKLLSQSAVSSLQGQLNKLPQFTPTADVPQVEGQNIQPTATSTPGQSTIALRGIGANRTLTLINGRRGTPANALGVIDTTTIPTAAIEYVDTISGGASSTYGADAVAGVVNFIMKDRFEGFELDAKAGMTQRSDAENYDISGIMGANIADDKGNIMMAFNYTERMAALQSERSWYRKLWADPSISGGAFFLDPYPGIGLGTSNLPTAAALNTVMGNGVNFTDAAGTNRGTVTGTTIYYDPASGGVFSGYSSNGLPGVPAAQALGIIDGYAIKMNNNGYFTQNDVDAFIMFPQERWNFYTQGDYEVNKYVTVFGQAYYSRAKSHTTQQPGTITSGWSVQIDPTTHRNSIPANILTILDSRANPNAPFNLVTNLPARREGFTSTNTYNMTGGVRGELPAIPWTYEAFLSHGEAEVNANMTGFYSLQRMRTVMQSQDFGRGMTWKANSGAPDYGFGGATATCTGGLNPFDWTTATDDCWLAVDAPVRSKQLMVQDIYELNTQGRIVDLPAGEMKGALGFSYRENEYEFQSDNINTQGKSLNDQVLGLYPAGESNGYINVKEEYAELLVPILKDIPLIKGLDLSLGARHSDYNTTGGSYTYKAQFDYRTIDYLRFRGGYNRAERAPNIGELYLARTSSFGAMYNGDTCSMRNATVAWSANSTRNPNHWQDVLNLCAALNDMANPTGDANIAMYGVSAADIQAWTAAHPGATTSQMLESNGGIVPDARYDAQSAGGFSWAWPIDTGNPNLEPETADTWTFGFVLDSFVDDIPALMDWRVSMDYYTIEVKDAIGLQTGDVVMQQCTSEVFNPTFDPNSPFCAGVVRDARFGTLGVVNRTYFNNGHVKTDGIDTQINWGMDVGPGHLAVSTLINYILHMKSTELASSPITNPMIDYVGTFGPTGNGLNGNTFKYKAFTTINYTIEDWNVSLRWSHYDKIKNRTGTNTPLKAYNMFDLTGSYRLSGGFSINGGIENLFNKAPQKYNVNYGSTTGMYGGTYNNTLQDSLGRRFYLGFKLYL